MIGTGVSNGNPNDGDNYFLYNDKCSLVLVIDYEAKNEKDVYKSADKNAESNVISLLDNINCEKENELMSEELNNRIINEANSGINSKNLTDEKFEEMILSTFKKNNFGKINNSSKEHGSFKESIKLNVGLDYSNFSIDTQYKIIKFITKGSHFLYWSDDVLVGTRNDITKEFKMNEMKKNNCEEMRNSRFVYFDAENKLLVLKYNLKDKNFQYLKEENSIYKYFFDLHKIDFMDDNLIKYNKDSIMIYPYTYTKIWKSVTSYINDEVINKIEPVNKTFSSSFLEEGKKDKDSGNKGEINFYNQPYMFYSVIPKYPTNIASKKESKKYEEKEENDEAYNDKNNKKEDGVSEESNGYKNNEIDNYTKNTAYFECINIDNKYNKYIPSNLTLINLERYWILEEIIKQEYTYIYYNDEKKEAFYKYSNKLFYILGEFQFSFILFHIGFNYQSFIQWRNLFELFSNSQILVTKHADFFEKLLKVVSIHLSYLSDDFFDNKENSFILFGVYNIFDIISNIEDTHENIKSAVDSIDIIIYNKLGLHIPDLSFVYEEYQPTYVNDD
ncbi:AAR2 protein, putative [Plasmodium berghei]|uniref:AAR2 protein, putative n=2 Tax=Plasmodium berghei TaxID=5821 RepID=A0A509ATG0_PLABA|nr:AAR2 protein, putative [Plasmodium berghei ANKA]CXJ10567.1 AAR2 protein, putative [Plasmodium berghei]SCM25965.1 AAR2 protein, putative [Plasmodium berghei]SCN28205.1 AAR2 protein, putative [Plasmodium berghei]SCO62407.1 AAR2 protein, putative [Plasmodium berghei]SCO63965.1 AAR2 protein, putative [Plasmodium berghei]|eukprot:XP_034423861.1 AAR2 protein, putative [Plasmodium berghei ANKA]